jgi:polar amino acid transport system substrate-binding protein
MLSRDKALIKMIVIFLILIFSSNSYAGETWKIASLSWPPYAAPEIENQGSSIHKLRELLKKEDITLIVEFFPWKRAKKLVSNNNEYVGIFPAWPEDSFDGAIVSSAVDWSEISVLKLKEETVTFDSIEQLFKKYYVGVVGSYIYPKVIDDAMKKHYQHVDAALNELLLLKKLAKGRGKAAITDPNVMLYLAEQEGISNIETVSSIVKKELVVAFRDDEMNRKRLKLLERLLKEAE